MTSQGATNQGAGGAGRAAQGDIHRRIADQLGTACAIFGVLAVAALVWLWSLTLRGFNPPNWIRIFGVVWLPIGVVGAVLTGIPGFRSSDRGKVGVGLSLAALAVIGFIALMATADY